MLSIITPIINGALFIEKNIKSIIELNLPFEHIIVDGGSTDGTLEIISKYPHLIVIYQTDQLGMYKAIDMGFAIAKGKYLTWVNADDMIIAEGYEKMYNTANRLGGDVIYSDGINHYVEKYKYSYIAALPFARWFLKQGIFPFVQPSAIFSKKAYYLVGGLDFNNFKIIGDRDLYQKIALNNKLIFIKVKCISSIFLRYKKSLLYSNMDLLKIEHAYTSKTNNSIINRILYHLFRLFGQLTNRLTKR